MYELPEVAKRFLRYVKVTTTSNPLSNTTPSSKGQLELAEMLKEELEKMRIEDVELDRYGYLYATLPSRDGKTSNPKLALLAHLDTSPDVSGTNVSPQLHFDYDGRVIKYPNNPTLVLDPRENPDLLKCKGDTIITSDGTTLLGSDDKSGVAVMMSLASEWMRGDFRLSMPVRLVFTVDEEIGRGVSKLDLEKLQAKVAYTIDGGPIGNIDVETFNAVSAIVMIEGIVYHPGYAKKRLVNAAQIAAEIAANFPESERPETTSDDEGYFFLRDISGTNSKAKLSWLIRDFSEEGIERRIEYIKRLVDLFSMRYPQAKIKFSFNWQYRNMRYYIEKYAPEAIEYAVKAGRQMGINVTLNKVRGGTDGSKLSELGVPTPNIFTGGYNFHSLTEWNSVGNLVTTLKYVKVLLTIWEHNSR